MEKIFLSTGTSYFIALVLVPIAIKVFKAIDLLDDPDERKLHTSRIPSMGGIPIFFAVFFTLPIWLPLAELAANKYLLAACFLIFLLGVRDDMIMLRARHKLFAQIAIGLIIIYFADIRFMSMYGIFGVTEIPYLLSVLLSLFTFIVITNSFNLIDGIDGLAGTIGMLILGTLGYWFHRNGDLVISAICFSTVGAILAFLYFNWQPARIFMGDTGSMFIGFLIAVFAVKFIDANYMLPDSSPLKYNSHIAVAVGLLSVPLFDTLRVFVLRSMKGQSPMVPDRNHLHHRLLDVGYSHRQSALILLFVNAFFAVVSYNMKDLGDITSITVLFTLACVLNFILGRMHKRKALHLRREMRNKQVYLSKSA